MHTLVLVALVVLLVLSAGLSWAARDSMRCSASIEEFREARDARRLCERSAVVLLVALVAVWLWG